MAHLTPDSLECPVIFSTLVIIEVITKLLHKRKCDPVEFFHDFIAQGPRDSSYIFFQFFPVSDADPPKQIFPAD